MPRRSAVGIALHALAKAQGRPWPDIVREFAQQGYGTTDVADMLEVTPGAFVAYYRYRELKFPWQNAKSPIRRADQSRKWKEGGRPEPASVTHTVYGITGNLRQLAMHFGLKPSTLYTRLYQNIPLADALLMPVLTRSEIGHLGARALDLSGNRSLHWTGHKDLFSPLQDNSK